MDVTGSVCRDMRLASLVVPEFGIVTPGTVKFRSGGIGSDANVKSGETESDTGVDTDA